MKQPLVIKVGGALLTSLDGQKQLFNTIDKLNQQAVSVVLVHGGGCLVDQWITDMGLINQKIDGLRVTPVEQIDVVVGALAGAANKKLVASAKTCQIKAIGISLCDGNLVTTDYLDAKLGRVGLCHPNERELLDTLLLGGFTPIISSIGDDDNGNLLNVNADQAAQVIAQLIGGKLILLSDVPGVLDGEKQLIDVLEPEHAKRLIADNIIAGGMKVKVETAFATAKSLNDSIVIASWKAPSDLLEFANGGRCGTLIKP
jgi:acetylglutamate kinase